MSTTGLVTSGKTLLLQHRHHQQHRQQHQQKQHYHSLLNGSRSNHIAKVETKEDDHFDCSQNSQNSKNFQNSNNSQNSKKSRDGILFNNLGGNDTVDNSRTLSSTLSTTTLAAAERGFGSEIHPDSHSHSHSHRHSDHHHTDVST